MNVAKPNRPTRWGVGPRILSAAAGYAVLAGIATSIWPEACLLRVVPYPVFLTAGMICLALGVPFLAIAGRAATVA
jgi:hypothetical protein